MHFRFTLLILFAVSISGLLHGQSGSEAEELKKQVDSFKRDLDALKQSYENRISTLEEQVRQLQSKRQDEWEIPVAQSPAPGVSPPSADTEPKTFRGGERTLQALNPEISVTGDLTARYSDDEENPDFNRMNFDGFEMAIQHPLDPFSQAKFFVIYEDGAFSLEEGYMSWESLPGRLGLKVGRFHNNFGKFNRYHKHALPWADRDLPTQTFFGEEGLVSEGVSLTWLPPRLPIAQTNELYFEVANNSNDLAFSGKGFGDPLFVGRLLNYYDVSADSYLEWGLSGATSHWDEEEENRSTMLGLDLTYRWQPLRSTYRSLELRTEFFFNQRKGSPGGDPFGMYVSGEYQLDRRWFAGIRYQYAEEIEDRDLHSSAVSPFLTFWQSEWVRLRAQYDFINRNFDDHENRFYLQFTWSLGPHKHEAY